MSGWTSDLGTPIPCPRKDCGRRAVGCHDECKGYQAYRKAVEALRGEERQRRAVWQAGVKNRHGKGNMRR